MRVGQSLSQAWAKTRWSEPKWVQHPGRRSTKDFWGPLEPSKTTAMPFGPPLSPSPSRPSGGPWGLSGASLKFWGGGCGGPPGRSKAVRSTPQGRHSICPSWPSRKQYWAPGPARRRTRGGEPVPGAETPRGGREGRAAEGRLLGSLLGPLRSTRPSEKPSPLPLPPPAPPLDF